MLVYVITLAAHDDPVGCFKSLEGAKKVVRAIDADYRVSDEAVDESTFTLFKYWQIFEPGRFAAIGLIYCYEASDSDTGFVFGEERNQSK